MSRLTLGIAAVAALVLSSASAIAPAIAQVAPDPVAAAIANADRLTTRRTAADCRRDAAAAIARGEQDIIVCASVSEQALPIPEVYGPVPGSTDGAAVRPEGIPCGVVPSDPCFEGIDLLAVVGFLSDKLLDIFNPDRDLGAGAPIPERYRGANR